MTLSERNTALDNLLAQFNYSFAEVITVGRLYTQTNQPAVIIDSNLYQLSIEDYQYIDYTSYQNRIMHQYNGVYRFLATDLSLLENELSLFLANKELSELNLKIYGANRTDSHIDPTPPEYNFALSFEQVFSGKHIHALHPEAPYVDCQGHRRHIDYVLHRTSHPIAIELNGEQYHHPLSAIVSEKKYRSQLFKQNSLVHDGYQVYRWSNRGMQDKFKFEDQLKEYFGSSDNFQSAPLYRATRNVDFELYAHQEKAVEALQEKRKQGEQTFLIVLPTGTGKTEVFIEDFRQEFAKGNITKSLAIVPSTELKKQLIERVKSQLPNINVGENVNNSNLDVIVQTSAYVLRHFRTIPTNYFDYILVDEAHRAAAHGLRNVLEHFTPKSLLGLTATDERLDQQRLEDIFGSYQVNLTLEEAIKQKLVPQIRAFRLLSNIDLSNVRFNGKEYIKSDLQKTVQVPSRDQLVVDLLLKYFTETSDNASSLTVKQGVIFCVDIKHANRMAALLKQHGIKAASVHGTDRQGLGEYKQGNIQFLCACDLLNEGWDAPQTSIIVMARPTMSKVLYTQQLGRGTRSHPDKEALYVIDVVDSYSSALQPWSVHSLFNFGLYKPFADLVDNVATPTSELTILDGLWEEERRLEPINIFNFEKEFGDLLNEEQLARELFLSTGTIRAWLKKDQISPFKTLPFGNKTLNYFSDEQVTEIKIANNIKERTEDTRKTDFYEFLEKRDYNFSYKIIFLLAMVNHCNERGEQSIDDLVLIYQDFYQTLLDKFGSAEKAKNPLNKQENLDNLTYLKRSLRENPFEKFERKRFFYQCNDLNIISFDSVLWEKMNHEDITKITKQMIDDGINYYQKINITLTENDFSNLTKQGSTNQTQELTLKEAETTNTQAANEDEIDNIQGLDLPFYPSLKIACGHFKTSEHEEVENLFIPDHAHSFGALNPTIHFVATASGNSMNGGKNPVKDGDLLLLELITPTNSGSISGLTLAIEMQDESGDDQYLLRVVKKQSNGQYVLVANNPDYTDKLANEYMHTFARLKSVLSM
ncbi:DEAD/DEAH box helicase [Colwellia sp. E2M01]|uniref:DEAD/DEAH box helicase n=1 Tax=Colwellia sp. E2M01 TaxID=2841561 RepID=UPI001C0A06DF|nr:DEAD/DEAH box helicase [Colwellia sp. E2M01]MBU2871114.1 DEAD/DEAH box helicase family protein [Colwellia sp. E2M01]